MKPSGRPRIPEIGPDVLAGASDRLLQSSVETDASEGAEDRRGQIDPEVFSMA